MQGSRFTVAQAVGTVGFAVLLCIFAALAGLGITPRDLRWPVVTGDFMLGAGFGLIIGTIGSVVALMAASDIRDSVWRCMFVAFVQLLSAAASYWGMATFASYVSAV